MYRAGKHFALLLLSLLMLVFVAAPAVAQEHLRSLTKEDGLSAGSVKSIYRDRAGFVFFGTSVGVDIFDGTFIHRVDFPIEEKGELCWVSGMAETPDGDLIVGNNAGVWQLNRLELSLKRICEKEINWETTCVERAPDGSVYVGTIEGLFHLTFNGKKAQIERIALHTGDDENVRDVAISADGSLWVAMRDRVVHVGAKSPLPAPGAPLCKIAIGSDRRVFVGTQGDGVMVVNGNRLQPYLFEGEGIADMMADRKGHLLVARADRGACEIDLSQNSISRQFDGARYQNPFCIYRDEAGLCWIGYLFFGIDYTPYSHHIFHTLTPPLQKTQTRCYLREPDRLLIGTNMGLYVLMRDEESEVRSDNSIGNEVDVQSIARSSHLTPHSSLRFYPHSSLPVISLFRQGNRIVVGTIGHGAKILDAQTLRQLPAPELDCISGANVYCVKQRADSIVALATTEGLLTLDLKRHAARHYTTANSQLPHNEIFTLDFDYLNRGWLSTRGGMCCLTPDGNISTTNIPREIKQLGMLRDITRNGKELFFLPQHGFPMGYHIESHKTRRFLIDAGEKSPSIQFFALLNDTVWCMASEEALFVGNDQYTRRFGYIDGLPTSALATRSLTIDRNAPATFTLSTAQGIVEGRVADLLRRAEDTISILVRQIFNDRLFNNEETRRAVFDKRIRLSRHSNDLVLTITPLLYADTHGLEYRYQLDDGRWQPTNDIHQIALDHLSPGNHRLRIEAVGMPFICSTYTIDAPLTWSAILLLLLLALIAALAGHIAYCKTKKKPYIWEKLLPKPEKYSRSRIEHTDGEELTKRLKKLMEQEKLYLKADLTISQVAARLSVTPHRLSQLFSQHLGITYYDYLSDLRIEEFKRRALSPEYAKYTIVALSEICGFRSRTTFNNAFKKNTGHTPKEWMKCFANKSHAS